MVSMLKVGEGLQFKSWKIQNTARQHDEYLVAAHDQLHDVAAVTIPDSLEEYLFPTPRRLEMKESA